MTEPDLPSYGSRPILGSTVRGSRGALRSKAAAAPDGEHDRRKTILRAAVEVFATKGYHGCRIADVAREAGVAYGLVYHYFQNKEELLKSVFELAWGGFVSRIESVVVGEGTLEAKLRGICNVAFDAYEVDPRGVRVIILEVARSPSAGQVNRQTAFAGVIQLAKGLFEDAAERGELRAGSNPTLCAALLFGALEMGLTSLLLELIPSPDAKALTALKEQLVETVLYGMQVSSRTHAAGRASRKSDAGST